MLRARPRGIYAIVMDLTLVFLTLDLNVSDSLFTLSSSSLRATMEPLE